MTKQDEAIHTQSRLCERSEAIHFGHNEWVASSGFALLAKTKRGLDSVLARVEFEVAVVTDDTAAAIVPEGDGYAAALVNFRVLANDMFDTSEAVAAMNRRTGD